MKNLIHWPRRGENPLELLRDEMDTLFRRFFGDEATGNGHAIWGPRVDVEETDKEVVITADLPGIDPKEIEITLAHDVLTLRGERKEEREKKEKNYHRTERMIGRFYREIALPAGTDAEKVVAEANNGVITIRVPKKPEVQAKKVAITPKG